MTVTFGALFKGYGGLEMGAMEVIPGEELWYCEIDPGACKVLAHHDPDTPNLGDVRHVDWTQQPRVDVLTLGFPCQDVSAAGKRAGLMHGTRSGLWHEAVRAIAELRPPLIIIENVRGLLTAEGDESPEYDAARTRAKLAEQLLDWTQTRRARATREGRTDDARRLAARSHRLVVIHRREVDAARRAARRIVRAIGTVLGTLADLGYDAEWVGLRAADVGAPHGRFRIFILAYPQDASHAGGIRRDEGWPAGPGEAEGGRARGDLAGRRLLPTPRVSSAHGPSQREIDAGDPKNRLETRVLLLPTPRRAAGRSSRSSMMHPEGHWAAPSLEQAIELAQGVLPREFDSWDQVPGRSGKMLGTPTARDYKGEPADHDRRVQRAKEARMESQILLLPTPSASDGDGGKTSRSGDRKDEPLLGGIGRLLPTPTVTDHKASGSTQPRTSTHAQGTTLTDATVRQPQQWGEYEPAIRQWEHLTRPAPAPTEVGPKGAPRLAPEFSEWMMGLPDGHVTAAPGITRNEALKCIGNGVCPPQATAAIAHLWARVRARLVVRS